MFLHQGSQSEKILVVADALEQQDESPFSAERLIVAAWKMFPRDFGLKGYIAVHPDSNKVITHVVGVRGLVHRGCLTKVGQKLYALSKEGRRQLRQFASKQDWPTPLPAELNDFIANLLANSTLQTNAGSRKELTFADARSFWGMAKRANSADWQRIHNLVEMLKVGLAHVLHGGTIELQDGRKVSADELTHFIEEHEYLVDRFGRQLQILQNAKLSEAKR